MVNWSLEDMLWMCIIHQPKCWEDYFSLVQFSFNNVYNHSLKKSPYRALHGWKCNLLVSWDILEPCLSQQSDTLQEMEIIVKCVQQILKVNMTNTKVIQIEKILMKLWSESIVRVKPKRSFLCVGKWKTLTHKYYVPFNNLVQIIATTYKLALPPHLTVLILF